LISRAKALLKRYRSEEDPELDKSSPIIRLGELSIDRERYIVINAGEELVLPKKEFELLVLLVSKPEKVFTRDEIYTTVWGDNIIVGDRTIDVHIRKLREKIGQSHIKTIKGVGYKFVT